MKKIQHRSKITAAGQLACTVSAAALMLGVSHAATVGFNFQCNYCGAHSYSGAIVTAPAFGIGTNNWESLLQMDTGYGCTAGYYTLNEVVDATTSTNGLNPLPNGSLNITWSAYTANVSGFGGYDRNPPSYTFGGNGYHPGNEQVYWGFLRDGVNFGPGSSGGDNNQPGYMVDIVGLKSLFTNTPFAVQLVASSDSIQTLTNAFIIDATANSTQSVIYPSTPPVSDAGGSAWVRGIGGGLSTASGAFSTDHLQIIGNRAAHGGNKTNGFDAASTIAGFILTDKPVMTMDIQPVLAVPGDTVVWSAYAVGVPPLSYQWRKNGVAIPGATTTTYAITNVAQGDGGNYDLLVTNLYGSVVSRTVMVDQIMPTVANNIVVDSNPNVSPANGLDLGATWLASSTDSASKTRSGIMSFNATNSNQIVVPPQTNLNVAQGTITFWMRSSGPTNTAGNPAMILDRRTATGGVVIMLQTNGSLEVTTSGGLTALDMPSVSTSLADNKWHHVALVFSILGGDTAYLYIDGALDTTGSSGLDWPFTPTQELELGLSHDATFQPFNGQLDDVRLYNRQLSASDVATVFGSDGVVDSSVVLRLNFDTAPVSGVVLKWQSTDSVLQSSGSVTGPFTDISSATTSPYAATFSGSQRYFRYHWHTPKVIVSNPYLM